MSEWRLQTQNGMMGVCYMHLPKTMPDALEVARKGDPMAICNAGWCYFNGIKVPRDQRKALDLWRRAAEKSGKMISPLGFGEAPPQSARTHADVRPYRERGIELQPRILLQLWNCGQAR